MKMKKLLMAGGVAALMTASTAYASIIDRPFFKVLGVVVVWGADSAGSATPVASDFVLLTPASNSAGLDLISANGRTVVTGSLTPISATNELGASGSEVNPVTNQAGGGVLTGDDNGILDAGDSLTAFGVDSSTDVGAGLANTHTSSFFVASNAPFDIYAQSTAATATGDFSGTVDEDDIAFSMSVTPSGTAAADGIDFGSAAQNPGNPVAVANLGLMTAAPTKVFDGLAKTADSVGTLTEQSVRFDNTYTLGVGAGGYDLSMGVGTVSADVTYTVYVP